MLRLPVTETGEVRIPVDFARQGVRFMAKIVKIVYKLPVARESRPGRTDKYALAGLDYA